MKKYIIVKEADSKSFELMLDGLSEQGYEIEPNSFTVAFIECSYAYYCLMSKVIE